MLRWLGIVWQSLLTRRDRTPVCAPLNNHPIASQQRYRCANGVVGEGVGEEFVLLQLNRGTAFRLNHTGMLIWELAQKAHSLAEIVQQLTPQFTNAPDRLERDVAGLLGNLVHHGLLEPISGEAA